MTPLREEYSSKGEYQGHLNLYLAQCTAAAELAFQHHKNVINATPDSDDYKESYFQDPVLLDWIEKLEFWGERLWEHSTFVTLCKIAHRNGRTSFLHPKTRQEVSRNAVIIDASEFIPVI